MDIPKSSLVAVDTQIWIWGGLRDQICGTTVDETVNGDLRRRSRWLMHELDKSGARLVMPAMVASELLSRIPSEHHSRFLAVVSNRFRCQPFDARASSLAAKLWSYGRDISAGDVAKRDVLKSDAYIIASAVVGGVRYFFTEDDRCRKMADQAGILGKRLPTHPESLFADQELDDFPSVLPIRKTASDSL